MIRPDDFRIASQNKGNQSRPRERPIARHDCMMQPMTIFVQMRQAAGCGPLCRSERSIVFESGSRPHVPYRDRKDGMSSDS